MKNLLNEFNLTTFLSLGKLESIAKKAVLQERSHLSGRYLSAAMKRVNYNDLTVLPHWNHG